MADLEVLGETVCSVRKLQRTYRLRALWIVSSCLVKSYDLGTVMSHGFPVEELFALSLGRLYYTRLSPPSKILRSSAWVTLDGSGWPSRTTIPGTGILDRFDPALVFQSFRQIFEYWKAVRPR